MKTKHSKNNKHKKSRFVILILQLICIALLIFSGFKIIKWFMNNQKNDELLKDISQSVTVNENETTDRKYSINFENLKKQNSDTIGWLKVENSNIEYPVVQTKDNEYYLKHNFNKEYNVAGWIFADYRNLFDGTDRNIVIYGHNMRNNSMFGSLKNVIKKEWYENTDNKYITLVTENEYSTYEVFSVYQIEAEDYYLKMQFKDDEFEEFITKIKKRSVKDFEVNVSKDDKILTLSTCANNNKYRVVLHAVKIN